MQNQDKTYLVEEAPFPSTVARLAVPTILSSLVMVLYNLADTYFVGMLGDPIENSAVTLAAPVLLAFNAVNNLFGVGTSSMMSRAWGEKTTTLWPRVLPSASTVLWPPASYFPCCAPYSSLPC